MFALKLHDQKKLDYYTEHHRTMLENLPLRTLLVLVNYYQLLAYKYVLFIYLFSQITS